MNDSMCVGPGTRVRLVYSVHDEDDDVVDAASEDDPLVYIHGFGQVLPALEQQIEGLWPGQQRSFTVHPADGYGEHDPDGLFQVERSEFPDPAAIALDDEFIVEGPDGEELVLRVVELVDDGHVLVDTNHPLAGATLRFEVTVRSVEPATDEELEEAEQALLASDGAPAEPGAGLVQLGRKPRPVPGPNERSNP